MAKWHRRTLIKGLAGAALLPSLGRCASPATGKQSNILIIGAGIAGLAAARMLADAGQTPIIIEARDRIGGRLHTSRLWPDLPADLGAPWTHGTNGNPLTALTKMAGMQGVETSYDSAELHIDPALRARGVRAAGTDWAEGVVERALAKAEALNQDISVQAAVDSILPPAQRTPSQDAQLRFYLASNYEQEYGGSVGQLSAWHIDDAGEYDGADQLFPGGYDQLATYLANGLDIRLGQKVTQIAWQDSDAAVTLANGDVLRADTVIITVPLGVLKANAIAFDPPLPTRWQNAINALGMGLLNKHFLRFNAPFWDPDADWHEFLHDSPGDWGQWVSLARIGAPCLLGFTGADAALAMESLDDAAIIDNAHQALRRMFGNTTPVPKAAQITRWNRDPFALGSYSFTAMGSSSKDRAALAKPEGALVLAGEAAHPLYPGTVHGALLSGQQAARQLLETA